MALTAASTTTITTLLISLLFLPKFYSSELDSHTSIAKADVDLLEFPLNLEFFEAEFFLYGALGYGLDKVAPNLTQGGPTPIGAKKANLDPFTRDVIEQFAYQEVGHLRAIQKVVKGFPRPLLDLSKESFAKVVDAAVGKKLSPPFDPYYSGVHYLLASYLIPYVGLTGYVGTIPKLQAPTSRRLVAGLLGVESGQDAIIRAYLYEHAHKIVKPYGITVAQFSNYFSDLRNKLGHEGVKDEGLWVPKSEGAEGKINGNALAGDADSVAYDRTAEEILRVVYGSGDEHKPGGFYPKGGNGNIARSHLL
ncbi:desiccation-related protein PCC13-62-like [Quercus lobata]|uniref:Desiccation-related protein PCC13-62 n=1 Tax=Quercus lobata TaxID=97700 RepID=A0A7N2LVC9_QUELO|nr:desiccation-related protein PCC13-62-like [Quercus lobata]